MIVPSLITGDRDQVNLPASVQTADASEHAEPDVMKTGRELLGVPGSHGYVASVAIAKE